MAFYERSGAGFVATELTRGPWSTDSQHAGPPCALLGGALERAGELDPARIGRVTFEILGPVALGRVELQTRVIRSGRSVELVEGELSTPQATAIRARAWRVRTKAVGAQVAPAIAPLDPPEHGRPQPFFETGNAADYQHAMDVRFVEGSYLERGPARAWLRMRCPLVAGQEPRPLERVLVAADSGNGISAPLDFERFVFINTDLSVALARMAAGDWVGLDSHTRTPGDGIGLTDTVLHDATGPLGRATQTLLIGER